MIYRITEAEADKRIGAQIKPRQDKFGEKGDVLMIGNGRYYFCELKTADTEMQSFIAEWKASNGQELPSFGWPTEGRKEGE